jgi:hypothetical protein
MSLQRSDVMLPIRSKNVSTFDNIKLRLTEFPDASRVFHSQINETPRDIATALGLDLDVLISLNRSNYPNISNDAVLQKGVLIEIPNSNSITSIPSSTAGDVCSNDEIASGTGLAVHVFGSGENVGKRTEGRLLVKDRNRPFVVQCNGRKELKLSEFCQLGGNKKNRPRESIIISSTNECLFEYECRMLSQRTISAGPKSTTGTSNATSYEMQKSKYRQLTKDSEQNFDLPEKGYLVTIFSVHEYHQKIGVVQSRSSSGWYKVGLLCADDCKLGSGLKSIIFKETVRFRGHNILISSRAQKLREIEDWAVQMHSALVSFANFIVPATESAVLEAVIGNLLSSIDFLRTDSNKMGFNLDYNGGWLQVLSCTSNPGALKAVCEYLTNIKDSENNFSVMVLDFIRLKHSLDILSAPLLALDFVSAQKSQSSLHTLSSLAQYVTTSEEAMDEHQDVFDHSICIKTDLLQSVETEELYLQDQLSGLDQRIDSEARQKRALARRQDTSIGEIIMI